MQTDVRLKALRESFKHGVHVDAVRVRPGVLEIFFQTLAERVGDLMEADELSHAQHLRVVPRSTRVQTLNDGRNVPEYAGVHQRCRETKT